MNLTILFHNCDRSISLEEKIREKIKSDPLFSKNLFTSASCWITKEIHQSKTWYEVNLVLHTKNHEDFSAKTQSLDPYSAFNQTFTKAKRHFTKKIEKLSA